LVLDVQLPGKSGLDFQRELARPIFTFRSFSSLAAEIFPCRSGR
jgi:hypothetical protein